MARNCPRKQLVITREDDPTFFDDVKNEHFLRHGSRRKLHPEVMTKFVPFLPKQAKMNWKRIKSLDTTNWTGSLSHAGALNSVNPKDSGYIRYGSVDSDIVYYVNREEVADERIKTIRRKRRSRRPTPSPPPHPARLLGVRSRIQPINEPLPSAPLMQNTGTEMVDMAAPTLQFVEEPPRIPSPPQVRRKHRETIKRI
jgi:hypothetical protein